ncbi:MAG: cytochrome c family protein [Rhodobacteraceae bacterium]|nr:cytochrome c family protein [Paracoccaceae bacterium]
MNTMEVTKIAGGIFGALLVFLLVSWGAESLYHVGGSGHGDEAQGASGYPIEVAHTEETGEQSDEPSLEDMLAAADVDKGKKVFSKCKACHKLDNGTNGVGPHLFGVMDRDIGSVDGFKYSGGMTTVEGNWDAATLDAFLTKPKDLISDTKMSFAGLKKPADRVNLIGYLMTIK